MYQKILVPLDGSQLAEEVLSHVRELAKVLGSELILVRVALAHPIPEMDPVEAERQVVEEARAYLEEVEKRFKGEELHVSTAIRYGNAAQEILEHAKDKEVDLIAMSTHGRSGLGRLLMGSVAETVLRHASVPVLIIRAGS